MGHTSLRNASKFLPTAVVASFALAGCAQGASPDPEATGTQTTDAETGASETSAPEMDEGQPDPTVSHPPEAQSFPVIFEDRGSYDSPWALEFLPGTEHLLITTRPGELILHNTDSGEDIQVDGVPEDIVVAGQGGLGDVVVAPDFSDSQRVYLSWVSEGEGGTGAVLGHGELIREQDSAQLADLTVIWQQQPKTSGDGHFGHRLAFSADGEHLFVTSGDRQELDPVQDLDSGLGKVMRLTPEGDPAPGNPFEDMGGVSAEIWTYGHRNPLGIDVDADGQVWVTEMGPAGGDEINLLAAGQNYGWPEVSDGDHYDGELIPDHSDADEFTSPVTSWTPSISPSGLVIYQGDMFPEWQGSLIFGALSGESLNRVFLDGENAAGQQTWPLERIRDVAEAPDGGVWIIEDGDDASLQELVRQD